MTRVKICGITSKTEIEFINRYLPDYIGFIFAESKRRVTPEKAADLAAGLSPAIGKVGVFVDMEPEAVADIAALAGLDALQLHGSENARYIWELRRLLKPGTEIWKSIRMGGNEPGSHLYLHSTTKPNYNAPASRNAFLPEPERIIPSDADRLILDTYVADSSGGTGRTFDWGLAQQLRKQTLLPFILAGGLHPGNVRQAIDQVSPYAVDTSSGVEGDGIKDEEKVRNFIATVRGERR